MLLMKYACSIKIRDTPNFKSCKSFNKKLLLIITNNKISFEIMSAIDIDNNNNK